jgi:hypothetical protein
MLVSSGDLSGRARLRLSLKIAEGGGVDPAQASEMCVSEP